MATQAATADDVTARVAHTLETILEPLWVALEARGAADTAAYERAVAEGTIQDSVAAVVQGPPLAALQPGEGGVAAAQPPTTTALLDSSAGWARHTAASFKKLATSDRPATITVAAVVLPQIREDVRGAPHAVGAVVATAFTELLHRWQDGKPAAATKDGNSSSSSSDETPDAADARLVQLLLTQVPRWYPTAGLLCKYVREHVDEYAPAALAGIHALHPHVAECLAVPGTMLTPAAFTAVVMRAKQTMALRTLDGVTKSVTLPTPILEIVAGAMHDIMGRCSLRNVRLCTVARAVEMKTVSLPTARADDMDGGESTRVTMAIQSAAMRAAVMAALRATDTPDSLDDVADALMPDVMTAWRTACTDMFDECGDEGATADDLVAYVAEALYDAAAAPMSGGAAFQQIVDALMPHLGTLFTNPGALLVGDAPDPYEGIDPSDAKAVATAHAAAMEGPLALLGGIRVLLETLQPLLADEEGDGKGAHGIAALYRFMDDVAAGMDAAHDEAAAAAATTTPSVASEDGTPPPAVMQEMQTTLLQVFTKALQSSGLLRAMLGDAGSGGSGGFGSASEDVGAAIQHVNTEAETDTDDDDA